MSDKRIVITGGNSGIGYEVVKQLHKNNELIVIARNPDKLDGLSQEFAGIKTFQADLANQIEVEDIANAMVRQFDKIDVLINNAAVQYTPKFIDGDFQYETIAREIAINFTAPCCLSCLLLPALLHEERSIILNVNSGLCLAPKINSAVYCATKGALNLFSQSLRYQLEISNVKVLQAIMPLVDTEMTLGRGKDKITGQEAARQLIYGIEHEIYDHDIGKVKLLRLMLRIAPGFARRVMKGR